MKDNYSSSTRKLFFCVLIAISSTVIIFLLSYYKGRKQLDFYFDSSTYVYNKETPYVKDLQEYIDENQITLSECERLEEWATEQEIEFLVVSSERNVIYAITYANGFAEMGNARDTLHEMWMYLMPVTFGEDTVDVLVYTDYTSWAYELLTILAAIFSILFSLLLIYWLVHNEMKSLKRKLEASERAEAITRESQHKMVQSMAHDLRTPLTGLIAYAEIVKLEIKDGKASTEHVEKILTKANEIKFLTDQIFDFSMIDTGKEMNNNVASMISFRDAFEDYLSDACQVLMVNGFSVDYRGIEWINVAVLANSVFVGRICNNLVSNICKYGLKKTEVVLRTYEDNDFACIEIKNRIDYAKRDMDSTEMGLKIVSAMMEEMGGKFESKEMGEVFVAKLRFQRENQAMGVRGQ